VLDGAAVSAQSAEVNGLFVLDNGGGSSFFGLVIKKFPGTGVRLYAGDNLVEGTSAPTPVGRSPRATVEACSCRSPTTIGSSTISSPAIRGRASTSAQGGSAGG
jgi:hypothetical protein